MAVSRPILGPRRSVPLAIVGGVFYTLLVGAGASVVRAAIMSSLALIAGRLGRRSWGLNTLAAATLLMTLQNPLVLGDVGFQLTAAATLGILLYGDRFQARVEAWAALKPRLTLVSVGAGNPEGNPGPQVLARLAERNTSLASTREAKRRKTITILMNHALY